MCIPPLLKYYIYLFLGVYLGLILGVHYNWIFLPLGMIFMALTLKMKCPNCNKQLVLTDSGIYIPPLGIRCSRCGQNLLSCKVNNKDE